MERHKINKTTKVEERSLDKKGSSPLPSNPGVTVLANDVGHGVPAGLHATGGELYLAHEA